MESVPPGSRKEVVDGACEAVDFVEATSGTEDDLSAYFATRIDNAYSYRLQLEELAKSLHQAGYASDQAVVLGRAAVCVWGSTE